jgi:formylglycine-generating enzyme required for sulfatase activity
MMKTLGMVTLVLGVFFAMVGCVSTESTARKRGAAGARELTLDLGNDVTMKLVQIPAGKFLMGSRDTEKDRHKNEVQHEVMISKPFYMGVYEVTQAQWRAVMGTNPSFFKGDNRPVEMVSWDDCQSFCRALSAKVGRTIRLPSEAEWEYACRAGTKTQFYFGDDVSRLDQCAWYDGNSSTGSSDMQSHDVGGKTPNAWGLHDMHGNVWEWCQDWYGVYPAGVQTDPTGPPNASFRVLRGGSCVSYADICRTAYRGYRNPGYRSDHDGFRLVLDSK